MSKVTQEEDMNMNNNKFSHEYNHVEYEFKLFKPKLNKT